MSDERKGEGMNSEITEIAAPAEETTAPEVTGVPEGEGQESSQPLESYWREPERIDPKKLDLKEEMVYLNRVAKVVKGGRRFSFAALMVVGDSNGHVGVGFGKANEVPEAIAKASEDGKKNLVKVPLKGRTIPHATVGRFGAARVMLKPASEGTGIIAGPAVRSVLNMAGVQDVLTKCIGTNNKINVVKATLEGLSGLQDSDRISRLRGKNSASQQRVDSSFPDTGNEPELENE